MSSRGQQAVWSVLAMLTFWCIIHSVKINNAINITDKVKGTVIIDGRVVHSILYELLSDKGSGTLIRA